MELVRGVPITSYCDMHRLSTRDRLALFIPVCQAVQHAHQKGVIHRDLKPSNVMVAVQDDRPVPKVIDFGIAKAVSQPLTERTLVTDYGQVVGTPAYMSPEQAEASGLDVDTRTDIYSLGVMLYELLVGRLPLDPQELGIHAFFAQLVMRDTSPPTPSGRLSTLGGDQAGIASSRQTDASALRKELKGDLDWVVMKAMDPDRTRRYETVNGLAVDLQRRWRRGRPARGTAWPSSSSATGRWSWPARAPPRRW
jgi:serine/threonine protein kinase